MNDSRGIVLLSLLFNAGTDMRAMQRIFFKTKTRSALDAAKQAEWEFDQLLKQIEREFQFEFENVQAHQPEWIPQEKTP